MIIHSVQKLFCGNIMFLLSLKMPLDMLKKYNTLLLLNYNVLLIIGKYLKINF